MLNKLSNVRLFQCLVTDTTKKEAYRPLFKKLWENLKRKSIWNNVEVHAIYAFFYTLCMSSEGIMELRNYMGANDFRIFQPLFIAQYLFCPVNTIVDKCFTN